MDLVNELAGGPRAGADLLAFFQEWDHLADEDGEQPTVKRFADYWNRSERTVHRELAAFRKIFDPERTPQRILAILWDGLRDGFGALMAVPVVHQPTDGSE